REVDARDQPGSPAPLSVAQTGNPRLAAHVRRHVDRSAAGDRRAVCDHRGKEGSERTREGRLRVEPPILDVAEARLPLEGRGHTDDLDERSDPRDAEPGSVRTTVGAEIRVDLLRAHPERGVDAG